MNFQPRIR